MRKRNGLAAVLALAFLLAGCAGAPPAPEKVAYGPGTIVAVWNLEDLSAGPGRQPELADFISAAITDVLQKKCGFKIVEREKLVLALEELNLGSSELVSESTRLRLGKILGARLMVFGAYQVIGEIVRLDLRLVDVESGLVVKTASSEVAAQDIDSRLKGAEATAVELCR